MSRSIYDSPAYMKLKNALIKILESEGLSISKLSINSGTNQGTLCKFLNGKHAISLNVAEMLLDYLGYEFVIVRKKDAT